MYFQVKKRKIMNDIDLKKRAEELELRLNLQLQQLKNDSQVYVLGGGIAFVTGLIAYGIIKRKRKKRKKRIRAAAEYTPVYRAPETERKPQKRADRSSSLFSTIKKRLLFSLLSYGQAKLVDELNRRRSK
jgi:hypothetical protein